MKTIFRSYFLAIFLLIFSLANAQNTDSNMQKKSSNTAVVSSVTGKSFEVTSNYNKQLKQDVKDILAHFKPGVDSVTSIIIGESSQYMEAKKPESLLTNLFADILLDSSKKYGKQADLAVGNVDGIRSVLPKGKVTFGDMLKMVPYNNFYTLVTLKGADLQLLMEQIAAINGESLSRGVKLVIEDKKLKSVTLNGKSIVPEKLYTIATIDYTAEGNYGMTAFKNCVDKKVTNVLVRDVYLDYFRKQYSKGKKVDSSLEGRVVVESNTEVKKAISLFVVHTNDSHSCIEGFSSNSSNNEVADKGGFLHRTVLIDSLRSLEPDMLLFDEGDFSQGSAYYNIYKGDVEVEFMNYMKYDACTIGNHEFDYGLENMRRLFQKMNFPVVCCNYDFSATCLKDVVKPYTIIERKGLKVGITGVGTTLKGMVSDNNCVGVVNNDPVGCANAVAKYLKEEAHCDIVICLSHLGADIDEEFIANTRNIDAVLGGHSHSMFNEPKFFKNLDGKNVVCNQQGKNARFVGSLMFSVEK